MANGRRSSLRRSAPRDHPCCRVLGAVGRVVVGGVRRRVPTRVRLRLGANRLAGLLFPLSHRHSRLPWFPPTPRQQRGPPPPWQPQVEKRSKERREKKERTKKIIDVGLTSFSLTYMWVSHILFLFFLTRMSHQRNRTSILLRNLNYMALYSLGVKISGIGHYG